MINLKVNGTSHAVDIDAETPLLWVLRDTLHLTGDRIVAAVDCGIAINPDIVVAQIEGAVGFALATALREQITLKQGMVEQSNFDDYQPTRIGDMPKMEVHIVKSSAAPSGIGEPGVPPVAPTIGNAIYAATGKRLRSLPFDRTLIG